MAKLKIHEIAKKIGMASKDVVAKAQEIGLQVTSHLSSIDEEQAKKLEKALTQKGEGKEKNTANSQNKSQTKKEKKSDSKKEKAPVIIRREVIVAEDEEKSKKEEKSEKKDVGFVQRNQNKDYNIVYRNKPSKPMTVSELFGLGKKKEEPKQPEKTVEVQKKEEKTETAKEENNQPEEQEKVAKQEKIEKKEEITKKKPMEANTAKQPFNGRNQYNNSENRNRDNRNNFGNRQNNNYRNNNNNSSYNNNNSRGNNNNNNRFQNRDRNNQQNNNGYHKNNNYNNGFQNRNNNGGFQNRQDKRPLDNKGIDKNIKNIMSTEVVEKESQRDYSSKAIDKAKLNNKYEEKSKKQKTRKNSRPTEFNNEKLKDLKQVDRLSHMFHDQDGGMLDYYDLSTERGKRGKKKNRGNEERNKQKIFQLTEITIPETITVKDFAAEIKKTTAEVIKKLFNLGIMATINQNLDFDTAYLVASEFGITATKKEEVKEEDILFDESEDAAEDLKPRPPVVVVMGHVDHGKTSLLDAVRSTNVIEGEAGGITQHIGAYKVNVKGREITFLDTPGHEAFTSMRARGPQITDVAILEVAADDGVMPQTIEAINHAKAAEIPIIVAVNKIDLPGANVEKIKQELMKYELVPEEWGGDTIFVPISAKKRMNIDTLLEMVLLTADMQELKANPNKQAKGTVIEARFDKAKGPIASVLVQRGTLDLGDTIVVGTSIGRIRAMKNDKGQSVKKAGPSTPVEIMGLTEVPEAGDTFYEVKNEKMAKQLIERRRRAEREKTMEAFNKVTLSNLFERMESENLKQLNIIVKADVQGTSEALKQSLEKLSNEEVHVKVIHGGTGGVNESDVQLAKAAKAIIIAFNVRPNNMAKDLAEKDEVEIKQYSVIYQALEDVESAMKGMLDPVYQEKVIGNAQVRQTFKVSGVGTIAGCYVQSGKIERNAGVRVIRDDIVIHDGKLVSLKRFKDDVKEVSKGFECGIQIENYNDIKEDDIIEVYILEQVK